MNWKTVKLGEAYWFQEGPGVRKWQFTSEGIKLLNVANILKMGKLDLSKTDRHLSVEEATGKYAHFLVDAGDLVIASSGISVDDDGFLRTRGAFVYESHLPLCLNTSTIRFKAKEGISTLPFLRYWIDSVQFREQISRLVTGSAQKNFGPSHLKAIEIPLPPLAEQQRIAARLDAADRLRVLRRDALARLDALTHSLFLEMFGDPAHNPMEWPIVKLPEISRPKQWPTIAVNRLTGSGYPVFGANGLIGYHETFNHAEKTVLITCRGATCGTINVCPPQTYVTGNAMALDDLAEDKIQRHFLEWYLKLKGLANVITGTAQPQITRQGLENYPVALPPLDLQRAFAERLRQIETVRVRMESSALELDALFASLQSAAFDDAM